VTLQEFDSTTERLESFPSNMPGANVRQVLGRPGEAWGGESGTDRVIPDRSGRSPPMRRSRSRSDALACQAFVNPIARDDETAQAAPAI